MDQLHCVSVTLRGCKQHEWHSLQEIAALGLTRQSMMSAQLCILLFIVNEAAAFLHPRQLSPCQVHYSKAYCSNLNLTNIPPQLPSGIHALDLSHNLLQNVTEDSLSSYSTIQQLNLHSNRIQFIQPGLFGNMTHLKVLDLSRNQLDLYADLNMHVGPLTTVQKLDLSGNGLYTNMSDYFLKDAPALTNLSLHGNSITKIGKYTFSSSPALKNIDLHNNVILDIEEGTFDSLLHLTELDLSINSISCITNFNLFQLKSLNLSKNSMTSFQSTESEDEFELLYLDLRENKIHYFPVLPRKNKIIYIDLSRNQLHSLNSTGSAEELPRLLYLDLSYNQLKAVPSKFFFSLVALETLNISNNCLDQFIVDIESPLNALKTLDLSFNNLQNLTFEVDTLQALKTLYLQGNLLRTLASGIFSSLPSIANLHLQLNELSVCGPQQDQTNECISFNSIPTLRYLYLLKNNLLFLPAHAFLGSPLIILDLSLNPGIDISGQSLSGLESSLTQLSLSGNQLEMLSIDLSLLHSLKVVDLSQNRLSRLSQWSRNSGIERLNLQNNSLVTLDLYTVRALESKLKTLYMGSNPLSCCGNVRLINLVQQDSVEIPDIAMTTCQYIKNAEYVEINLRNVKTEHCETLNSKVLVITMITVLVLALLVVLLVAIKLCHSRSHRFNNSYKA